MPLTKVTGGEIDGASSINVTGIVTATSFSGDVSGNINSSGVSTFSTLRVGTGVTISSGVVTATSFVGNLTGNVTGNVTGNATGLSGTPSISVNSITAATATFTGNVSVAGTVTYDDVTNVDSIGIVTARTGVRITDGGLVVTAGISTFSNGPVFIGAATSTGTASQPLQVTGGAYVSGNVGIGTTLPSSGTLEIAKQQNFIWRALEVKNTGTSGVTLGSNIRLHAYDGSSIAPLGGILVSGSTWNYGTYLPNQFIIASTGSGGVAIAASIAPIIFRNGNADIDNSPERARFDASGNLGIGLTNPVGQLQVASGPVIIGAATSTGTATQRLQVTGGAYVSGNTGIGTTNPSQKLHLFDTSSVSQINESYNSSGYSTFEVKSGIGTTAVSVLLYASSLEGASVLRNNSNTTGTGLALAGTQSAGADLLIFRETRNVVIGNNPSVASQTGTTNQKLQVQSGAYISGNLGIGTTNPQAPLHVVGTGQTALLVSGNARVTGILTVGTSSLTFDGNANTITGLSTITGSSNFSKPSFAGISSTNADNIVDVFVYDTRKDSDGGAWRKRTQNTSWYTETLNTATRGSRKEFPAVAVIVATSSQVTIYDGDDPDMPMWMVFQINNYNNGGNLAYIPYGIGSVTSAPLNSHAVTSVYMLNGQLFIGANSGGTADGVHAGWSANFLSEIMYEYLLYPSNDTGTSRWQCLGQIVNRNSSAVGTYPDSRYNATKTYGVANYVNDVAMTVLPNAPIDPATGLPVPTIACACLNPSISINAGLSIIKDNGNVYKYQLQGVNGISYYSSSTKVYFDNNILYYTMDTTGVERNILRINVENWNANISPSGFYTWNQPEALIIDGDYATKLNPFPTFSRTYDLAKNSVATDVGLALYYDTDPLNSSPRNISGICGITSTYNTGWMHGNIKGAFLSGISTTSVTGTELVTNGDFATLTLTSYTQLYNCSLSVVSNQLRVTSTAASGYAEFYVNITDTTKYHYFSFQFVGASGITQFGIYAGSTGYITDTNAGWTNSSYTASRSAGTYTLLIPPGNGTVGFVFNLNSLGQTWTFDNISLKPVQELDRSVNNRGLAVYGTITKTAVATGADLVAYSGFSASNYLFQPYNSALDFGTGDFCYMGWVKDDSVSAGAVIFQRGAAVNSNETVLYIDPLFRLVGRVQTSGNGLTSNVCFIEGQWNFVVFLRTGNTIQIYNNGVLQGSATNTETMNQSGYGLSLGAWLTNNSYFPTSLALWRVSASAPSPDQIKKIYNDEKVLFQNNAKSTLYGTVSLTRSLSYDDSSGLLYVGTASGRSDFRGLQRINNTTTAVTTAISASNGLVAEQ